MALHVLSEQFVARYTQSCELVRDNAAMDENGVFVHKNLVRGGVCNARTSSWLVIHRAANSFVSTRPMMSVRLGASRVVTNLFIYRYEQVRGSL